MTLAFGSLFRVPRENSLWVLECADGFGYGDSDCDDADGDSRIESLLVSRLPNDDDDDDDEEEEEEEEDAAAADEEEEAK